jgi:hypothetical protein
MRRKLPHGLTRQNPTANFAAPFANGQASSESFLCECRLIHSQRKNAPGDGQYANQAMQGHAQSPLVHVKQKYMIVVLLVAV